MPVASRDIIDSSGNRATGLREPDCRLVNVARTQGVDLHKRKIISADGYAYIIANLPEPDVELAQQQWLTLNQMHPSPIQGWPFGQKVK